MKQQFVSSRNLLSVGYNLSRKKKKSNGRAVYVAHNKNLTKLGDSKRFHETQTLFKDTFIDAVMDIPLSATRQLSLHLHEMIDPKTGAKVKYLNLGQWQMNKDGKLYCRTGFMFPLRGHGIQLVQRLQQIIRRYEPDEYAAAKEAVRISRLRRKP